MRDWVPTNMRSSLRSSPCFVSVAALLALPLGVPLSSPNRVYAQASGDMVKLTFPNADVRDVLTQYELLVGKRVIYDNTVQGQVNINVPEVPKEDAIRIIEITLLMNGYHLVPSDVDPNLVKALGVGKPPRSVGVPILAEPEPIPDNEQVIVYMVKLRWADPTELAQVLQQAMPPSRQEYAPNIVALPKAQALLVTENTAVLRGIMRIIRAADVEPTRVEGEFIALQRASAKDVVQMLEKLFEKPQTGSGAPAAPRPVVPAPPKPADGATPNPSPAGSPLTTVEIGGLTEDSMVAGKVRLTADERTNRIYLVSRPVNLPVLRKLIQQFDEDVPFSEPLMRPLKFVSAGDILEALVKAVSDPGTKDTGVTGAGGTAGQNRPQTPAAQPSSPFGNQFGNRGLGGGLGGGQSMNALSLQTEPREIIPQTVLVGNARIMADKRQNAIFVIGSTDIKEKVSKILDQLDVRTPQVMLTTVIGELTLADGQEFGVNYLLHNGRRDLLTGGSGSAVLVDGNKTALNLAQLLADPRSTRMMTANSAGLTGFISAGDSLAALVTALESTSKFKVTSRPSIFASNNKKAMIVSGERIAVVTGSQSGLGTGSSLVQQNQVQYIDVNLNMEVVPLINSDREVYLDIVQNLAEITRYTTIKDSNSSNEYPVIANRQLQTAVMVPNEGTLVLGGLIKESRNRTRTGVPVLGKVPLLGGLFRTSADKRERTELVVLIRPSVSSGPDDTYDVRDRNMKPMRIPVTLEDELFIPDVSVKKKGRSRLDSVQGGSPDLKPFRANPDSLQPADVSGERQVAPKVPVPAAASSGKTVVPSVGKNPQSAPESSGAAKNAAKPQRKGSGE